MKKVILTNDQLQLLIHLYVEEQLSLTEIEKRFQIGKRTLSRILKENGIEIINRQNLLNFDVERDIVPLYLKGVSLTKIAEQFNTTRHTLSRKLKQLGYDIINQQNISKFNEHVFDTIDTEEKAYWLGFIYADGYISYTPTESGVKSKYGFELSLKYSDAEHLHKFNKFMEHNKDNVKLDSKASRCRWFVANKHLWETLNDYGCTYRKSLTLQFPDTSIFTSPSLIRHFIRGYFDGDGCISYSKTSPNSEVSNYAGTCSLVGTYLFLSAIKDYLETNGIECNNIYQDSRNANVNILRLSRNNSRLFLKLMYNDCSTYLDRKYKRAMFFKEDCRSAEELAELLQSEIGEP